MTGGCSAGFWAREYNGVTGAYRGPLNARNSRRNLSIAQKMSGTDTTTSGTQKAKVGRTTVYRTVNPDAWLGFFAVNPTSIPTQPAANTSAINAVTRKRHLPPMNTANKR